MSKWAAWTLSMSKLESSAIGSWYRQCGRGVEAGVIRGRPGALGQSRVPVVDSVWIDALASVMCSVCPVE